jgi:hypothetical protein
MDEESRRKRIPLRGSGVFPKSTAGSKGHREASAEARPLPGGTTALESEGIALPAGPTVPAKLGVDEPTIALTEGHWIIRMPHRYEVAERSVKFTIKLKEGVNKKGGGR